MSVPAHKILEYPQPLMEPAMMPASKYFWKKGYELHIDVDFVEQAAMLHDIGIIRVDAPGIDFACSLGMVVCMIAIPQVIIFLILFFAATAIFPLTTPGMINDFKACGGFLMLATGFRMVKLKNFPTADMIPAMVLIMPMSCFWVNYILPLVS